MRSKPSSKLSLIIPVAVGAAIVGGLVVGLLLPLLPAPGTDPAEVSDRDDVRAEVGRLDARIEALESAEASPLEGRLEPAMDLRIEALQARVAQLERRVGAPTRSTPAAGKQPAGGERAEPDKEAEVEGLLKKLGSTNDDQAFAAAVELAELGDARAIKPLVGALRAHKDFYVRLGAASALGKLGALDAVPALIDAMDDRDELVRTAAVESLYALTGENEIQFHSAAPRAERVEQMEAWRTWWKAHEADVRAKQK